MPGDSSSQLSIVVKLVDEFSNDIKKAREDFLSNLDSIQAKADQVRNTFGLMGGAIEGAIGFLVKQAADNATAETQLTSAVNASVDAAKQSTASTTVLTQQKQLLQAQLDGLTGKLKDYTEKVNSGKDVNGQYASGLVLVEQKISAVQDSLGRLNNQQKLAGQSAQDIVSQFDAAADAGIALGFVHDDTVKSLTNIFRATGDTTQSLQVNQEAMDLARAKSIDLSTAGTLIIQAMEGNSRGLKQFGINLKDGLTPAEALNELQIKLSNSSKDYVNTPWGQLDVAKAQTQHLAEALGTSLLPALNSILQILLPYIQKLTDLIEAHPKLTTAILIGIAAFGALSLVIAAIAITVSTSISIFLGLVTTLEAVGAVLALLSGPIIALGILIALFAYIVLTHWNDIKVGTQVVWDAITGAVKAAVDYIAGLWDGLWNTINGIIQNVLNAVNTVKNAVASFGGNVAAGAGVVAGGVHAIVPKFASGGIVTSPTLGLIGEAGPEAVIPLSKMGSLGGTTINVTISGNTISKDMDLKRISQAVSSEIVRSLGLNQRFAI